MANDVPNLDIDNHFSDLYVRVTNKNTEIIKTYYQKQGINHIPKKFKSNIENDGYWYDIPFKYIPYWKKK